MTEIIKSNRNASKKQKNKTEVKKTTKSKLQRTDTYKSMQVKNLHELNNQALRKKFAGDVEEISSTESEPDKEDYKLSN